jgi:hypothetical protein
MAYLRLKNTKSKKFQAIFTSFNYISLMLYFALFRLISVRFPLYTAESSFFNDIA